MLIALANQKGGTGKTTLATNLAGLYAASGHRTVLADTDPQRTALDWCDQRPGELPRVTAAAVTGSEIKVRAALHRLDGHHDVVIVDAGGRISPAVRAVVRLADFLLVPTLASLPDIRSTEAFYHRVIGEVAASQDVYGAVVLNAVQAGTLLAREAVDYLRQSDLPLLDARLGQRVAFREAIGRGMTVAEYEPRGRAALEVAALLDELQEVIS